ncbi:MAG: hypothetical protein NZ895_02350 [Archaeoglobaceae archaeon]|nr:hypothetical protein [Archaeoglobaceae archaeon]MCX8152197.1 hypothetical protein [Archaeoglobaceae archaeon]MDW8013913.1 hypothetical protein [Archaeoglobaceae archaeon]
MKNEAFESAKKIIKNFCVRRNVAVYFGATIWQLILLIAKEFKKVYIVSEDEKSVEVLWNALRKENIRNVGIILIEPKLDFEVDLLILSKVSNKVDKKKLLKLVKGSYILVVDDFDTFTELLKDLEEIFGKALAVEQNYCIAIFRAK